MTEPRQGPPAGIRSAEAADVEVLAEVWHDGWHEAHAHLVPADLTRWRTMESFRARVQASLAHFRVAGPRGAAAGFHVVKDDELYQLFVTATARGSGVATALIADAEARLASAGVGTAWLACAIGNDRAARFYQKCGWQRTGTMINHAEIPGGTFPLEVWRYEKVLR